MDFGKHVASAFKSLILNKVEMVNTECSNLMLIA